MFKVIRRGTQLLGLATVIALLTLAFGCYPNDPQSTFEALGPVAESQLILFWVILGAGAIVFVAVEGAIIYTIIKYRRRRGDGIPHQTEGNHTLEFAWTVGPTILLVAVAVPTVITIFDNQVTPDPDALTVEVIGHQWWFEFRYPHPDDPEKEIIFANDLHIPINEVVNVNLDSVDVIHSFWIPKIAGKVDMVPGNDNTMWIQADRTGLYYGQCAEFCGVQHAKMRFKVIAQTRPEFDAWLRAQAEPAIESQDPLVAEGRKLFSSAGCSGCHATDAVTTKGTPGREGPNLTHVASRTNLAGGVFDNLDENGTVNDSYLQRNLRNWIEDPEGWKTGNLMATRGQPYNDDDGNYTTDILSEADLSALVAYVSSLK